MPGKVLIITYYWPPSGGAGVQRWLKFTKYLPSAGWTPFILTVKPECAAYPFRDPSLYGDIPLDIEVFRTKATNYFSLYSKDNSKIPSAGFAGNRGKGFKDKISRFIRGNFFIPDPRKGWNRYAFKEAVRIIHEENISHVITTSPPHSTQLIGLKLKRRFPHIRWIADLRDPWTDIYYYEMFKPTRVARMIDRSFEKKVLTKSDLIITVGYSLAEHLREKAGIEEGKIHVLHNGYDEEDFESLTPAKPEVFTVTYVGTLSEAYPVNAFLEAVKGLVANEKPLKLRFVGSVHDTVMEKIVSAGLKDSSEFIPYSDHPEAIKMMMEASLLLLIIPDHPTSKMIITGKLFEYIATGKPVLFIGPPDGEAAQLLIRCGYKGIFGKENINGIQSFLIKVLEGFEPNHTGHHYEYSRRALASSLGALLNH